MTTRSVTLTRGYAIARHEVTQKEFLAKTGHKPKCVDADQDLCQGDYPVVNISWSDAANYCNILSRQIGAQECYDCSVSITNQLYIASCSTKPGYAGAAFYNCPGFRLPTEAEWEYAYRAGSETELFNGQLSSCNGEDPNVDAIAWYSGNSEKRPHLVEQKNPNAWGLYDMAGNAAEFVQDQEDFRSPQYWSSAPVTDPLVEVMDVDCCAQIVRGGGYGEPPSGVQASARQAGFTSHASFFPSNGFRPVRTIFQ